jgi:hypothetical protein
VKRATRKYKCRLLESLIKGIPANSEVQFQLTSTELTNVLVNKKVHTKENGDVWRIVTETGESGNLNLSRTYSYIENIVSVFY